MQLLSSDDWYGWEAYCNRTRYKVKDCRKYRVILAREERKKERKKKKKKTQIDNHKNLLKKEEEEDNHK